MVNRLLCSLFALFLLAGYCRWGGAGLAQEPAESFSGYLEVAVEPLAEAPYEQEMVLLTIRGFYPSNMARQTLDQPPLRDVGWMQLGSDDWHETTFEGRQVSGFERTMAVFPQRSGTIEIGPFVHRLTFQTTTGSRFEREVRSQPVAIEVRPKPVTDDWWLPARGLRITDTWDRPPDRLGLGELATRTVSLEVQGVGPELLPPAPTMRSPGIMAFSDPETRSHELTPEGPVSRVTWRWTVRSVTSTAAILGAVRIPWFDTRTREVREAVIAQQRVGLAGSGGLVAQKGSALQAISDLALPIGLLVGLAAGFVLLLPGLRFRNRAELFRLVRPFVPDPMTRELRRAARAGDARAVRAGARSLIQQDREEGRYEDPGPQITARLSSLDRSLFGPPLARPDVDLHSLVENLLRLRRLPRSGFTRSR